MNQMSKEQAKKAETTTTPILNLTNYQQPNNQKHQQLINLILKSHDWKYNNNLNSTKSAKKYLISKLGNPLYHANYEYREAVWGFTDNDIEIILYYSTKGFSIQLSKNCTIDQAIEIIDSLLYRLS